MTQFPSGVRGSLTFYLRSPSTRLELTVTLSGHTEFPTEEIVDRAIVAAKETAGHMMRSVEGKSDFELMTAAELTDYLAREAADEDDIDF